MMRRKKTLRSRCPCNLGARVVVRAPPELPVGVDHLPILAAVVVERHSCPSCPGLFSCGTPSPVSISAYTRLESSWPRVRQFCLLESVVSHAPPGVLQVMRRLST